MARRYQIPTNFQESGYAFNGMIAYRNLFDAAILFLVGLLFATTLPFEGYSKLSAYILIGGLFAIIGITGINGVPFSTYIMDLYGWRKRRKPYLYNSHGGVYSMSSADVLLNEPQLRDTLADAIDSMKEAMNKGQPDYIEGKTFEFAEDPELVALKDAEERRAEEQAEKAKELAKQTEENAQEEAPQPVVPEPEQAAPTINVQSIMSNITLSAHDEGGSNNG